MSVDPVVVPPEDPDIVLDLDQYGVFEYLTSLGYPVTRYAVKMAVQRRELVPNRLGRGNRFSRAEARAWVHSRKQSGHYRAPESAAADGK